MQRRLTDVSRTRRTSAHSRRNPLKVERAGRTSTCSISGNRAAQTLSRLSNDRPDSNVGSVVVRQFIVCRRDCDASGADADAKSNL